MNTNSHRFRRLVGWLCFLLASTDVGLALWAGHNSRWFFSKTWTEYVGAIIDSFTLWTGRIVWAVVLIIAGIRGIFSGKTSDLTSPEKLLPHLLSLLRRNLPLRLEISMPLVLIFAVTSGFLIVNIPASFPYVPPSSGILITPDEKEIYAVDEAGGRVVVLDNMPAAGGGLKTKTIVDLNRSNIPAHPERLAITPDGKMIYAVDTASDEVIVIDRSHDNEIIGHVPVGRIPHGIEFTPDGDKAYVSNEGPIPQGSISVIDVHKQLKIKDIKGLNCPEGLAIPSGSRKLYVSSQCGYGEDPVFVVDTVADRVLDREVIPKMATGTGIAVSGKHHKLYVARGNFPYPDATSTQAKSPFTIIDTRSGKERRTIAMETSVNLVVLTPDENYVLVSNGDQVSIIDTDTDKDVKDFYVGPDIRGIAVSKGNAVYVLYPGPQIRTLGLSGLVPTKS